MSKKLLLLLAILLLSGCSSSNYYGGYEDEYYYEEEEYGTGITSDNWDCTYDCSGHEAGYEWAGDYGIDDPYDCDGNSDSFIEGCEAYANEQLMEIEEEYYEDEYYDEYYY